MPAPHLKSHAPSASADNVNVSPQPLRKKPPPKRPPPRSASKASSEPVSETTSPARDSLKNVKDRAPTPCRKRSAGQRAQGRSSSADDAVGGRRRSDQGGESASPPSPTNPRHPAHTSEAAMDPRFDEALLSGVLAHFGEEVGQKVLYVFHQQNIFHEAALSGSDRGGLLLGAAIAGLRTVQMGKLKDWLREQQEREARAEKDKGAGGGEESEEEEPEPSAHPPLPPRTPEHCRGGTWRSTSTDDNTGGGGGGGESGGRSSQLQRNSLSMSRRSSVSGVGEDRQRLRRRSVCGSASVSTTVGASFAQLVGRRFHLTDPKSVLAFLNEDCLVNEEEELGWGGESVLEAAKTSGRLNLVQMRLLEQWVTQVWQRERSGRRSSQEILMDPFAAKAEEDALKVELGVAVEDAIHSGGDPEAQQRAKHRASVAMYQLSQKKRHYQGLRTFNPDAPSRRASVESTHPPLDEEERAGGSSPGVAKPRKKEGTKF